MSPKAISATFPEMGAAPAPAAYEAIYTLQGSLRDYPLEADLEEERRTERKRENER